MFSIFVNFLLREKHVWIALTFLFSRSSTQTNKNLDAVSLGDLSAFWVRFLLIVHTDTFNGFYNSIKR